LAEEVLAEALNFDIGCGTPKSAPCADPAIEALRLALLTAARESDAAVLHELRRRLPESADRIIARLKLGPPFRSSWSALMTPVEPTPTAADAPEAAPLPGAASGDDVAQLRETADRVTSTHVPPTYLFDSKSRYVRGSWNISVFFATEPGWTGRLRWNARESAAELDGRPLTDKDLVALSHAVAEHHGWSPEPAVNILVAGVQAAARGSEYDPVREWLESLRWDGVSRLEALTQSIVGRADATVERYLRRWMIGAVARAYRPGCEMQNMLVFVGPQGIGKSRLLKRLAVKPEWYRESAINIENKDGQLALLGPWIVEVGELSGLKKAELEKVRVFISESVSRFRRPYGRIDEMYPRHCVFAGTTNTEQFNRDHEGARRMWAIPCAGPITLPEPAEVEQLWAEAVAAYKKGEPWYESFDETRETLAIGDEHFAETVLDSAIEEVLHDLVHEGKTPASMKDVLERLRFKVALPPGTTTNVIGATMKRNGWTESRVRLVADQGGVRKKVQRRMWHPPAASEPGAAKDAEPGTPPPEPSQALSQLEVPLSQGKGHL
jgi:hypothetical protein